MAGPVDAPLTDHGPRARLRRYVRALTGAAVVAAVAVVLVVAVQAPVSLLVVALLAPVVGVALAADRSRSLGHTLVDGYVVARSGSLDRRREMLAVDDVIGWTFEASWFQRRAGLLTLVATTAGGRQAVRILDIPEEAAVGIAHAAVPGLVSQFLTD